MLSVLSKLQPLDPEKFGDQAYLESFAEKISEALEDERGNYSVEVIPAEWEGSEAHYHIKFVREHMGSRRESLIDKLIVSSSSYKLMTALADEMHKHDVSAVMAQRGTKSAKHVDLTEAVDWLMQDARKGMTIQRYKGLGEMNADQLRDTTMDMSERLLRKVKIEDIDGTDETFEILMGDKVPPRREFIETRALSAKNIDI